RGANAGADGVPGRGAVMLVTSGGELPRAQGARYPRNLTGHQDGTGWSRTGYVGRPDSVSGNRAQDRRTDACRRLRPAGHRRRYSCAPGDEPLGLRCHANTRADHGGTCGQATRAILDRDQRKAGAVWQVDLHRRRAPALLDLPGAVNVPPSGGCQASLTLPTPKEIVPLLSCVLARRSILSIGGFSLAGGPDNQEIVRQHTESHLDPHTLQTPTTEPTQTPVGLGIREPQFHRLAPLAVDRLGLGRL